MLSSLLTGIPRLYKAEITEFGSKTRFTLYAGALSLRPTVHQISLAAFKFRFTSAQLEIELFTYCRIYASVPMGALALKLHSFNNLSATRAGDTHLKENGIY
jgi:hypothetical protein